MGLHSQTYEDEPLPFIVQHKGEMHVDMRPVGGQESAKNSV